MLSQLALSILIAIHCCCCFAFFYFFYRLFTCVFKKLNSSACECSLQKEDGFVLGEEYTVNVMSKKNLLFTKIVGTTESSK